MKTTEALERKTGNVFTTFVLSTTPKMKLKKSAACTIENTKAKKSSFSLARRNLSGCLPNIIRNDGLITANSFVVKKKRNKSPIGPDKCFEMDITLSSLITLFTIIVL